MLYLLYRLANDQVQKRQLLNEARAQNVEQYRQPNWGSTFQNCASSHIFGNEANHDMGWAQLLNMPFEFELNPTALKKSFSFTKNF
uniref:Uncharacterized protein n=1 Tax=Globodera pallida TaxID=36090 RepID=A0A183CCR8_GLOPA